MKTIQDRIQTLKNIFFANGVKCDSEQFLIEDINNLIKEVEEETRKEERKNFNKHCDNCVLYETKQILSITNKEKQK